MIHIQLTGAAIFKLANKFTMIVTQHNQAFKCKIKQTAIISPFKKLVVARTFHSLIETANKRIFAFGGSCSVTGKTLDSIELYTFETKIWQLVSLKLPQPLQQMAALSLPEGVLVLGGSNHGKASKDCFMIADNKILQKSQMPIALSGIHAVPSSHLDAVHVFGPGCQLNYKV